MRLDKFLKVSRIIKRRTVANDACDGSHIFVNGRAAKASYDVKPGEKLLSVRELAAVAGVNPNTMQKALSELESTGLVHSNRTSGRFVCEDPLLIQKAKNELARENISLFLSNMEKIGIKKEESIELLKEFKGGEQNE